MPSAQDKPLPNLKHRPLVAMTLLALAMACLMAAAGLGIFSEVRKDIARRNLEAARMIAREVETFLEQPAADLDLAKALLEERGPAQTQNDLAVILRQSRFFDLIQVLDARGRVLAAAPNNEEQAGLDLSSAKFFTDAAGGRGLRYSDSFLSAQTGDPTTTLSQAWSGGVVAALLNLRRLSKVTRAAGWGPGGFAAVVDGKGVVLAHSDADMALQRLNLWNLACVREGLAGREDTFSESVGRVAGLASVCRVEHTGWLTLVFQPEQQAFPVLKTTAWLMAAGLAACLGLALGLGALQVRTIRRPIEGLTGQLRAFARGERVAPPDPGFAEMKPLTDEFMAMTERVRGRERELSAREAYFHSLFEGGADGIFVSDLNATILDVNARLLEMLATTRDRMVGEKAFNIVLDWSEAKALGMRHRLKPGEVTDLQFEFLRDTGATFPGEVRVACLVVEEQTLFISFVRDVSERRLMEERLRQSEKMDAVGQLAGGVAHDFNNQLSGIMGNADLIILDTEGAVRDYAQQILLAARRAADLNRQLLAFARKGKFLCVSVNLHGLVGEVVSILGHTLDKRITISLNLEAANANTLGDPTQLQNVLLNLALNARDAMPEGGSLIFATADTQLAEADTKAMVMPCAPGAYVALTVGDTGCGIDPKTLARIFEPFFTTKAEGKGTGLGLSAVYGAMKNHQGGIKVESWPGRGTSFTLFFPAHLGGQVTEAHEGEKALRSVAGARVMVVDDEEAVREVAAGMLRRLGCEARVFKDGVDATQWFARHAGEVDLVVLDWVMPRMSGKETFLELRRINPKVRVLLASGYSQDGEPQQVMEQGVAGFIQKPFQTQELALKIAETLSAR